ncbi:unnamed protein product [Ectocarpus sp. CCAP 1310/34]|nr:unnamed protein product [Ectocarpus sp. CCAP 1310/34]
MAQSLNHLQRGYVPFSGDPVRFEGWVTLTRSLMSEAGLSRVMSGAEIAPAPLPAGAIDTQIAGHEKIALKFKENNGKVYTRLPLATSDGPDGYSSPASQVVQQHGPVGDEEYGDGRGVAAVAAVVDAAAEVMAAELQTVRPVEVGRTATTTTTEPPEETAREMRMADAGMIAGAETLEVVVGLRIPAATVKDVADTAVHNTQDSTTQAWYTRVEAADDELEDFAIVFDNDKQELNAPAVALPRERAAAGDQEQDAAAPALPDGVVIYDPQVWECAAGDEQTHDVPESALPNVRATDDLQEFAEPAAATDLDLTTPPDSPAEKVTELVRYTSVFQVDKESKDVGDTTLYIDTAASSHMVDAESRMSKRVFDPVDCAVRIIGSCGTSSATKKGTLKFGIRSEHGNIVTVALDVLLVRYLGANILSVGALAEKGVKCDLMSMPPALRRGDQAFPISIAVPRMYMINVIIDDLNMDDVEVYRTKVDAHLWHRRMGHCNPRALQQLAEMDTTGVKLHHNIESGDCSVCAVGDSKKGSHPPSDHPHSETRLEIMCADVWGKHPIKSFGGCQSTVMFTDVFSRMRFGFPITTKDETAESLHKFVREVADPIGQSIGTMHCDGAGEFQGRFLELCKSLGITVKTSAPYTPQQNSIAERGFGTIIGTTRKLMLGAPHLPSELWAEAFQTAIYLKNRTPTEVLGGKSPLEVWEGKPLGNLLHIHEWGSMAFKHEEARFRPNKLAARAKKMYMVGYNTKGRSYRLWDPAEPSKITNSAEVSFREKEMRDVVKPKVGRDPFPVPNTTIYQPGMAESNEEETNDDSDEEEDQSTAESTPSVPEPRRSARASAPPQRLNLFTVTSEEDAYQQVEQALLTGGVLGNVGTGNPGEIGYRPPDPTNYDDATRGPDADHWRESMREENRSLTELDVYDWVKRPADGDILPSRYLYKRKYAADGELARLKSRIVVQGFHQEDTGEDKASSVATLEAVHLVVAVAAQNGFVLKQADIKTAFLHARIPANADPIYVCPPKGFECSPEQARQVWGLKAWLYGFRLSPKGWCSTFHDFLIEKGFVQSKADPCLYILEAEGVILLVYVDDILLSGKDEEKVMMVVDLLKERFNTVFLGDAQHLLGMKLERNVDAGTIFLSQETYAKTVLDQFGMAESRPVKTPAEPGPISIEEEKVLSPEDTKYYRSATGSLLYLSRGSRPDITHSVMVLAKSMAKPGPRAMTKLKRVLRYLKGTTSIGITYTEDADGGDKLTAYVDSDFAGDQDKGYSTTGAVLYLAGAPVDWISKKQTVLAISTFEAEAVALSKACTIVIHFRNLLKSLNMKQEQPTVVFEDNTGAIAFAKGAKLTPRTKHIDVKYHHVRYLEEKKIIDVKYIETNLQKADILTKSQGAVKFLQNRLLLLGV